jgi:hypothetical protein
MINFYEKIEDYLSNSLNEEDKNAFEKALQNDQQLVQETENQRFVIETLKQSALRAQVEANLAKAKHTQTATIAPMRWSKAAAVIGVLFSTGLAFWLMQKPNNQQDTVKIETPAVIDTVVQKPTPEQPKVKDWLEEKPTAPKKQQLADVPKIHHTTEPESHVRDITDNQKTKGQTLAEQFFQTPILQNIDNQEDKNNFDAGISFLQQKKYEDAGRSFLKIKEESNIYAQSQWFFALSLLARDRYDTAKNILEDISYDEKNPFQEKAKDLMGQL